MAMDAAMIERLIKESLPDAQVSIEDLRGDGDHYAAHVVSGAFRGKTRVQQHQMVYQALRGRIEGSGDGNRDLLIIERKPGLGKPAVPSPTQITENQCGGAYRRDFLLTRQIR